MASIKERTVKGKTYVYVSSSASYKGEKRVFEKSIGPKDGDEVELERKREFYSKLLDFKKELFFIYLETKYTEFEYLPQGYAFPLAVAKRQYNEFLSKLCPPDLQKYKEEFEIRYVYNTTTIEGNTLSLQETAMVLDRGLSPSTKELREIHEVENFVRLREYVNGYKKDINLKFICKLHEFIQRNIDDDGAGCIRRIAVGIKGSEWEPPPAIAVEEELESLISWYDKNKNVLHPVELAGIFHHRFLQIHPFKDGNGRVARELLNFILERNDYPPLIVPVGKNLDYFECLASADNGDETPLLEFFAIRLFDDYSRAISEIRDEILLSLKESTEDLKPEDVKEIFEVFLWFVLLIKDYIEDVPEKVGQKMLEIIGIEENQSPIDFLNKLQLKE